MSFPDHIEQVLESFGISAETRSALLDSYLQYGAGVLDTFVDLTERVGGSVAELTRLGSLPVA